MKKRILAALAGAVACTSSCTIFDQSKSTKGADVQFGRDAGVPGREPDYRGAISKISLPTELDPEKKGAWDQPGLSEADQLSNALKGFYKYGEGSAGQNDELRLRRNRVQDRIIMASNQACDVYKRHLLAIQSVVNYTYGNFELLTAGLGAVLKPAGTSRALAAAAAVLSGSRAEWNDDFFRKLLAEVITRGISVERQTYGNFITQQKREPIDKYSVEEAIADALQYHSKCTLIAGLENAQKSQSFYADPGLIRFAELTKRSPEDLFSKILAPQTNPTPASTNTPTGTPTGAPTGQPTGTPTGTPTTTPTGTPTGAPTTTPTGTPTTAPTESPPQQLRRPE